MKRIKIDDGTSWPDPTSFGDLGWKLIHAQSHITREDMFDAAGIIAAYKELILHPAFTLKTVQRKVSGVRKAIKERG